MKNTFTILVLFFALSAFAQNQNILLIIADDVGIDPIPNYESSSAIKASMPNLQKMMEAGVTFDNVWANPVCSPTRATILTGKYGKHTGVLNPGAQSLIMTEEVTIHEQIEQTSGGTYSSSLIGKWHLSGMQNRNANYPNEVGVDYYAGLLGGAVQDYNSWNFTENGQTNNSTEYVTSKITDLAIDWINDQNQPWFCWVAYNAPHTPFHLPPANMHSQGNLPSDQASIDANPLPYYLAMLESVDSEMGRIFESIPEDQLENTTIIFIGDNGTPNQALQAPYQPGDGKTTLKQGGVEVPMVISGKGVQRSNEREEALINSSDLFTTIVELTGTELPKIHNSISFKSLLEQEGPPLRTCIYAEANLGNRAGTTTRNETYKIIEMLNQADQFFNLIDDPYESDDLLSGTLTTVEQAAFDELKEGCTDLISSTDNSIPLVESLEIYPNPSSTEINIFSDENDNQLSIIDLTGRVVQTETLQHGQNQISISNLATGWYVVKMNGVFGRFEKI